MSEPREATKPSLTDSVQFLKGVGPDRAERLAKLGLHTARDLLYFFPRDYEALEEVRAIGELREGRLASVSGVVEEVDLRDSGNGRSILGVLLRREQQYLRGVWFNQPFLRQRFSAGRRVVFSGEPKRRGTRWEMTHPKVDFLDREEEEPTGGLLPVYRLTEGVRQPQMRRIAQAVAKEYAELLDEVFPDEFLAAHQLPPIAETIRQIHAPESPEALDQARGRLVYQELLVLQLALAMRRERMQRQPAPRLEVTAKIDARIRRRFPFPLTDDQDAAVEEICQDLAKAYPMNRLLQGDVGSGKTVVAEYAMLTAIALGRQAVMMAPTDVLARQHEQTLERDLAQSKVRIGLLTGSTSTAARRQVLEEAASGELDILVGTHAISHAVSKGELSFAELGLVIIDEQHKFGVRQRARLKQAGLDAHYLVMTATPIPRTVSISLFGDLDVSSLRQRPPGRQPVHTYLGTEDQRERWWEFFRKKLREGRQGYVIAPLVESTSPDGEEAENPSTTSLQEAFEALAADRLESFRLDLVHGRMDSGEKDAAMEAFRRGETQVLVAASVVEVGVDVPNATLMTIESGERFGLAQLHQLRGRISRGVHPGYLCVFSNPQNDESEARIRAFAETNDGFALAELDFQLRGPGDIFGTRQHGLPPLRIADLIRDQQPLQAARRDAQQLIANDPEFEQPEWARMRRMVLVRFGKALELGDVG